MPALVHITHCSQEQGNEHTYMYHQNPVLYPFGYGLSHSDFVYEKIESVRQDKKNIRVTRSVKRCSL